MSWSGPPRGPVPRDPACGPALRPRDMSRARPPQREGTDRTPYSGGLAVDRSGWRAADVIVAGRTLPKRA